MSLKEIARKIPGLVRIKNSVVENIIVYRAKHNPIKFTAQTYERVFGRQLDLDNPKTLNEKMIYTKFNVYWDNDIVAQCADKFRVQEYVTNKGCGEILNKAIGVWERAEDVEWDKLPQKFAIKCNHGSGFNILCTDKTTFNTKAAERQLRSWLKTKYGYGGSCEQGIYRKIKPLILAEPYIETDDGLPPKDYKFFCSFGKCKFLFVASERINGRTKFDYYWPDWEWIPVKNCHPNAGPIKKPDNLEKMIEYAETLSKDFPIVRVDLYEESGKIIFGELTFTHFGCTHRFDPDDYDTIFGNCMPDKEMLKM